jgi:hypothetical protein
MQRQGYLGLRRAVVAGTLVITVAVALLDGAAAASTSTVPGKMAGCWHRQVPTLPVGTPAGVWLMKFTPAGKLVAYAPGMTSCGAYSDIPATVSVAGSHLTIGPLPLCATKGVYTWKAGASTLTLRVTADKRCSARALLFTGVWRRK